MYKNIGKRIFDILLVLLTLPLQLLVFVGVSIAILIEDRGSIFYLSERRGKDGKVFKLYKYRSMTVGAIEIRNDDLSTFVDKNDVRITRVGRILRKTSLDELPQLINVLFGSMSLVGPRPNLTKKSLEDFDDFERKRITVLPGITGYSQAYFRNSITASQKYEYDCYYVDCMSFVLDLKIIGKTFSSVVCQNNIYE